MYVSLQNVHELDIKLGINHIPNDRECLKTLKIIDHNLKCSSRNTPLSAFTIGDGGHFECCL